jgi:hypothetical protein
VAGRLVGIVLGLFAVAAVAPSREARAQTAQVGAVAGARGTARIVIDHVGYRAARYETDGVHEPEDDEPNRGGFVSAYFRNVASDPVRLRFWRLNGRDESAYRVDRRSVWDRTYHETLPPGATTVVEINGTSADFGPGKPFAFAWVDDSWEEVGAVEATLAEDPVQTAFIRLLPGLAALEVFLRHTGEGRLELLDIEVVGRQASGPATWSTRRLDGPGLAIARLDLAAPLASAELVVVKATLADSSGRRSIFAHRRAFVDRFPTGTWGADEPLRERLHRMKVDTAVVTGQKDDSFFGRDAARLGMRAMVHTGVVTDVDRVRDLSASPHVACWMIQDEPDWTIPATQLLLAERTVRSLDTAHPTMITLCRNVKFFEYAPLVDIPCMDHYCVTAPSSSAWPHPWGTRLEETAFYTRDLKAAAEPRPVWVWTQGLANWSERPARPVPTVPELSAQLVLNLSRGAKGILWFSYDAELAARYPDVDAAMAGWGRALAAIRDDLLAAEPCPLPVTAPAGLDARLLVGRDSAVLCLTNLDYDIDPAAYRFREHGNLTITVTLPEWLRPTRAVRIDHGGGSPAGLAMDGRGCRINVDRLLDAAVVLLPNDAARAASLLADLTSDSRQTGGAAPRRADEAASGNR